MTARKMFERLGYKLVVNNDEVIQYALHGYCTFEITFYKHEEIYIVEHQNLPTSVSVREHKAINQQLMELGWLDVD